MQLSGLLVGLSICLSLILIKDSYDKLNYILSLVVIASNVYCFIPIDAVQEERGGRKLVSMPAKGWSFVNTFH